MSTWKHIALFVGGSVFGTAGPKIFGSDEAKKVYTHITAAGLRAKEDIVKQYTNVKENCDDIVSDAKQLNEERAAAKEAAAAEAEFEDVTDEEEETEEEPAPKKTTAKKK